MTKNLMVVGFGLVLLLACDRQVPADYFPLKAGQQRAMKVYTRMIEGTDTTETSEVSHAATDENAAVAPRPRPAIA